MRVNASILSSFSSRADFEVMGKVKGETSQVRSRAHVSRNTDKPSPSASSAYVCAQVRGADAAVRGLSAPDPSALPTAEKSVPVARHDAAETARYTRQARRK